MRVIRGMHNFKHALQGSVVTIGNFDGVHTGHQAILQRVKSIDSELNTAGSVITFEPPPAQYFLKATAPRRLMKLREKLRCFELQNIDQTILLSFNQKIADLTAEAFMQEILVDGLRARHVVVGEDFRFGKNRLGDFSLMQSFGAAHNFQVEAAPTVEIDHARVSSTAIRNALMQGDCDRAQLLLGRPLSWEGRVVQGDQRGREWGFPTANLPVPEIYLPMSGVYAVEVLGLGNTSLTGVANLGVRPTVAGPVKRLLEVHLLDFDADIYGKRIRVNFLKKIRDEQKFDSFIALKEQIGRDVIAARGFFNL